MRSVGLFSGWVDGGTCVLFVYDKRLQHYTQTIGKDGISKISSLFEYIGGYLPHLGIRDWRIKRKAAYLYPFGFFPFPTLFLFPFAFFNSFSIVRSVTALYIWVVFTL